MAKEQGMQYFEARNPNPGGRIGARGGKQRSMSFLSATGERKWHTGSIAALLGKGPKVRSLIGEASGK